MKTFFELLTEVTPQGHYSAIHRPIGFVGGPLLTEMCIAKEFQNRCSPTIMQKVWKALELAAQGDTSQTCSPGNESIVTAAMEAIELLNNLSQTPEHEFNN